MQRGGGTGPHRDGWGITFYEDKGCRTFKDPAPCYDSPIAKLLQSYPIKSRAVVGHIRQVNRGHVALENTHPFTREQWGRFWTFAHNGQLSDYQTLLQTFGILNCLLSDGNCLFAYCSNTLHWITRRAPFGQARLIDHV